MVGGSANHARAWKDIPTEAQSITVLNFRPLFLERLDIHDGLRGSSMASVAHKRQVIVLFRRFGGSFCGVAVELRGKVGSCEM